MTKEKKRREDELPKLQKSISESPELRKEVAEIRFLQAQSELVFNTAIDDESI